MVWPDYQHNADPRSKVPLCLALGFGPITQGKNMFAVNALLERIRAARPDHIDLTTDELDLLSAYLATLPDVPPSPPTVLGSFSAAEISRFPTEIPDPAGTERWRRRHLEFVRMVNERRLGTPQASVSDPGERTVNLSPPSRESEPEADDGVWISFALACSMTGMERYEITRAWQSGRVRSQGEGKNRKVHSGDLAKLMDKQA
jgi:hypothetical protein